MILSRTLVQNHILLSFCVEHIDIVLFSAPFHKTSVRVRVRSGIFLHNWTFDFAAKGLVHFQLYLSTHLKLSCLLLRVSY